MSHGIQMKTPNRSISIAMSVIVGVAIGCYSAAAQNRANSKQVMIPADQCAFPKNPRDAIKTPHENKDLKIGYALFGKDSVVLTGNASSLISERSAVGCFGELICGGQRVRQTAQGLKYVLGQAPNLHPARNAAQMPPRNVVIPEPPTFRTKTLNMEGRQIRKSELFRHESIRQFSVVGAELHMDQNVVRDLGDVNESMELVPADYVAGHIHIPHNGHIIINPKSPVRIFLRDQESTRAPVFFLESNGEANLPFVDSMRGQNLDSARNFQVFYGGLGTIKLGHNIRFRGLIYAPNAHVELGPNNVEFRGAIVAKTIKAQGNVSVQFDPALATEAF